jgi:hypothetical protein
VDDDLPGIPHHHEGQLLALDVAVALVERVRASAEMTMVRNGSCEKCDSCGAACRVKRYKNT